MATSEYSWTLVVQGSMSVLKGHGEDTSYLEGVQSISARLRYRRLDEAFAKGYLANQVEECQSKVALGDVEIGMAPSASTRIQALVKAISSNVGRAIVGVFILQCSVKALEPEQSVRLHKGGTRKSSFGWTEGISMRTLDSKYVTPTLRRFGLLNLNSSGCFMTRSLAENYPYTQVYKAEIRGARQEWLDLVDMLESGHLDAEMALRAVLVRLEELRIGLIHESTSLLDLLQKRVDWFADVDEGLEFGKALLAKSPHPARLFEIILHCAIQSVQDAGALSASLLPLSQMRSANKKHGNIGDVELAADEAGEYLTHAWDAKFGKPYLLNEIDELVEKLDGHENIEVLAFVTDGEPALDRAVQDRLAEAERQTGLAVNIISFRDWFAGIPNRYAIEEKVFVNGWLVALIESICLQRIDRAPIDEPVLGWIVALRDVLGDT